MVLVGLAAATAVGVLFYSSFFADPAGVLGPLRAAGTYIDRAVDPAAHVQPWHYYLGLLAYSSSGGLRWTEGLVLGLAAVGAATAYKRNFWARYLTCNVAIAAAIFSAIPYKTPWNLLPFYVGAIVLAGIGFSTLVHATASRAVRAR